MKKLEDRKIVAYFDGIIASLDVAPGDYLEAKNSVGTLIDRSYMTASVEVVETDVSKLKPNQVVNFTFPAYEGGIVKGYVVSYPVIGTVTQRGATVVKTEVRIDNPPEEILPNFSFTGEIEITAPISVTLVERNAIGYDQGSAYVEVLNRDGTVSKVDVEVISPDRANIYIPDELVPKIIGKNGKRIAEIEDGHTVKDKVKGGEGGWQHFVVEGVPYNEWNDKKAELSFKKSMLVQRKKLLETAEMQFLLRTKEVELFISSINDSVTRRIIRLRVLDGYSWKEVADKLIEQGIVTKDESGVYYITDMNKLINYILEGKKWSDIGLTDLYGNINIASTDPVSSSPGATYYGLLLTILTNGNESSEAMEAALPKLKQLYDKSGYMGVTPADLFEKFMKIGQGTYPLIVDYEKSLMEFRNRDKDGYNNVKDHLRILYSKPTVTNSHCIATFTENGNKFLKAFDDKEIQELAWKNYGFRVEGTGGVSDVSVVDMKGIPSRITSGAKGLKMDSYNRLIEYLKEGV